ncbi:MAG TPA: hypothetical protein VEC93_21330, partial [Anaerolineae bacterium]|nr:hypothetical protein [Anaerolineae bacterium]
LDLSLRRRHSLGRVYDLIIQRDVEKKVKPMPDPDDLTLAASSSTKVEPTKQLVGSLSSNESIAK